ncbi:MAG: nitroreductase/quinone reductase family protein [Chloroflexota bacterium]|jgi:deazaflavin-dependent oxidoreductase (nitroreductase family)
MSRSSLVIATVAGVGLLAVVMAWRRVPLLDRLVLDRSRPYVHQSVVIRRLFNPIAVRRGRDTVLTVRGRRSGEPRHVPMDPPFVHEGRRYLVSPLGDTHWARNLRAAGEAELRIDGRTEHIRVVELEGAERDALVSTYAATITCGCRHYMAKLPNPADHPTFRIEPFEMVDALAA